MTAIERWDDFFGSFPRANFIFWMVIGAVNCAGVTVFSAIIGVVFVGSGVFGWLRSFYLSTRE